MIIELTQLQPLSWPPLLNCNDKKTATNVTAQISAIKSAGLLKIIKSNWGIKDLFSKKKATHEQKHNLLSFKDIGTAEFENYMYKRQVGQLERDTRKLAQVSTQKVRMV